MGVTIRIDVDDRELVKLINAASGPIKPKIVADGVNYGVWQETGTTKMAARPCATPAIEAVRGGFAQAFAQASAITSALAQGVVEKTAQNVERLWKQNIITKGVVDTGAYLNSVHVVDAGTGAFSVEFESMRE